VERVRLRLPQRRGPRVMAAVCGGGLRRHHPLAPAAIRGTLLRTQEMSARSSFHEVVPDDATLIAQATGGSERAFAALYHRHARYVAGVAYRLLGHDAELDDVVQEAFSDAARALGSLKDAAGLRKWLASIAVRRVHK